MTKNLRLFQISDTADGKAKPIPDLYFSEKEKAKAKRRALNKQHADGVDETKLKKLRFVVSPGPDHQHHGR